MTELSEDRQLTEEDRVKIARLLESGTPENQNLAFSLIEETAGQEDIAGIFTMNVIIELICLKGPESLEAMVRAGHLIHKKCPKTWKVFSEAVVDPGLLTTQRFQALLESINELSGITAISSAAADQLVDPAQAFQLWQHGIEGLQLGELAFLSDVVAKSLSQFSGELCLDGLTELTDAAAESLGKHKDGKLSFDGLTELSDAAAEALSRHEGELHLNGLTELSDSPGHLVLAEKLSRNETGLFLDGLTSLSDAAAESLSKHQGECLELDGLTSLSDAAAESLNQHQGELSLQGLQHLSDAATASLSKHRGELKTNKEIKAQIKKHVSSERKKARKSARIGKTALTKKQATKIRKLLRTKTADNVLLAVQLIDDSEATKDDISDLFSSSVISLFVNTWDVDVWNALAPLLLEHQVQRQEFTELVHQRFFKKSTDSQASVAVSLFNRANMPLAPLIKECQILGNFTSGGWGPTELSDAGAQLFVMSGAHFNLGLLTSLSDAAAESLSKHKGVLWLNGLTSLSDAAAESLRKHDGDLYLPGLTSLSDAAAESFSKRKGDLNLSGLTELSEAAAESIVKIKEEDLFLDLSNLPASAAQILRDAGHE